jgi:hypothetical protein
VANLTIPLIIDITVFILFLTLFPAFFRRVKFLHSNTPALILTNDTLTDNINLQTIYWTDIEKISAATGHVKTGVRYIAISLITPEKYIANIANPYKRFIAIINEKYFGGTFSIQPTIINCKSDELLSNLKNYHDRAKES